MMGIIIHRIGIVALNVTATAVALGFLVAALVAWLAAILGLPAAPALTGIGFLAFAFVLALVLRSQSRVAGIGLATLLWALLRPDNRRTDQPAEQETPEGEDPETWIKE